MPALSPRQQSILNRVIETHIDTGQPVGSEAITSLFRELYRSSYSPATVRYEMVFLEEEGYLIHPHTSAGRIPTDRGYRYYVEHGLRHELLSDDLLEDLKGHHAEARREIETFVEGACRSLAVLSEEVSMILLPVETPAGRDEAKLPRSFLWGTSQILAKPEFQDMTKAKSLLKALEEREELLDWLLDKENSTTGLSVTIGQENRPLAFRDCTLIAKGYTVDGRRRGVVTLIGPRRMRYARLIPLVDQVALILEWVLERRENISS